MSAYFSHLDHGERSSSVPLSSATKYPACRSILFVIVPKSPLKSRIADLPRDGVGGRKLRVLVSSNDLRKSTVMSVKRLFWDRNKFNNSNIAILELDEELKYGRSKIKNKIRVMF